MLATKEASQRRLEILQQVTILEVNEDAKTLTRELIERIPLPRRASADAAHIALAVVHGMDCLAVPVICTPDELLGEYRDVEGSDR